jgi:Domain of unknown function (DUF4382)
MSRRSPFAVLALAALGALALVAGCGRSIAPVAPKTSGFGAISMRLTDAPASFDHIFLDVTEVWVHRVDDRTPGDTLCHCKDCDRDDSEGDGENDHEDNGHHQHHHRCAHREFEGNGVWHQLDVSPGIYDLLDLRNGVFRTLAVGSVPAGTYDQVRLKLAADNTIVVGGVTYPLKVPSGQESGYKLFGRFVVPVDGTVDVGIDLDAARSVHPTGSGKWILIPVARIFPIQTTGSIHGTVSPAAATSWVYAMSGADTVTSTMTSGNGSFTLALLPPGDYAVHIVPTVLAGATKGDHASPGRESVIIPGQGFRDTTLSPVHVTAGQTTELGTIVLGTTAPLPGRLIGVVLPDSFTTRAFLLQSGVQKDSTSTGAGGHFAFENLSAGSYDLHLVPGNPGFRDTTLTGFAVSSGATTDIGTVALSSVPPPPPPPFGDEFNGTTLSSLWQAASWQGGGSATVGGGILSIDGFGVSSNATFGTGNSVEFVATFRADGFQNVGFATGPTFNAPWVAVGTGSGNGVYARSSSSTDVLLGAGLLGSPHRYRIDWTATGFTFSVDGVQATTLGVTVASPMNVELSDYNPNATALDVDWVHVIPNAAPRTTRASAMRSVPTTGLVRRPRR